MREKSVIVLAGLLKGQRIKVNDSLYCLDNNNDFCLIGSKDKGSEILIKVNFGDFTLRHFIEMCNKIDFAEVFIMGCETVLTDINSRRRE